MKFILGTKLRMSQVFDEKGASVPVTLIEAGPCQVIQIKTPHQNKFGAGQAKEKYEAIQIGFKKLKGKKIKKTQKEKPFRYLREFRGDIDITKYKVGQEIDVSVFQEGDRVLVSGISKGKGFAGVVKRWGFAGKDTTHGTKHETRMPGSIGSATPSRVVKGKKMPGRMGGERVTIKNLKIVKVDKENNILAIKGAIPGRRGTLLEISNF